MSYLIFRVVFYVIRRIVKGELEMNAVYPGLPLFYSLDDGESWLQYKTKVKVDVKSGIKLMSK